MSVTKRIEEAIKSGEVIKIKYHGGSNKGAVRELIPRKIVDDRLFRAVCNQTKKVKTFLFENVEFVELEEAVDYDDFKYDYAQLNRVEKREFEIIQQIKLMQNEQGRDEKEVAVLEELMDALWAS
ncbi:hypothetical protein HBN50_07895 [Halobacteriovorax sp. GB3]|uniref:hypothetical protein n=1 Tax=Halobacteriovorax sp. GB3 TaxID=2719615 RepID=UPI002360A97A|nr:hypothetical protein [Halobacteriovorax sp. GB3]MDD0853014.1 hypothetical protein [Halobacteriovorax sp. GB3]